MLTRTTSGGSLLPYSSQRKKTESCVRDLGGNVRRRYASTRTDRIVRTILSVKSRDVKRFVPQCVGDYSNEDVSAGVQGNATQVLAGTLRVGRHSFGRIAIAQGGPEDDTQSKQ
jgi:hypothetical protein